MLTQSSRNGADLISAYEKPFIVMDGRKEEERGGLDLLFGYLAYNLKDFEDFFNRARDLI